MLASLAETFPGIDWEKQGAYFFQRVIEHGRRRAEEVREVAETVREIGLHAVVGARHGQTPRPGLPTLPMTACSVRKARKVSRATPIGASKPTVFSPAIKNGKPRETE